MTMITPLTVSSENTSVIDSTFIYPTSSIKTLPSIHQILSSLAKQLLSSAQSEEEKVLATASFCLLRYELEAEFQNYKRFFVLPDEILQLLEGESYLEIGMGDGSNLQRIIEKKNPALAVGIDLSPSMVNVARKKIPNHNSLFFAADMLTLKQEQLPQPSFDNVLILNVLDRCAAPKQLLRLAGMLVKPTGKLILGNCAFQYTKKLGNGCELVYSPAAERVHSIEEAAQVAGFNKILHSFKDIRWQPESALSGKEDLRVEVVVAKRIGE